MKIIYTYEYLNKVFNYLTIVSEKRTKITGKQKKSVVDCICKCGETRQDIQLNKIMSGHTKSCGCIKGEKRKTHGMAGTCIYKVWDTMRHRCNNINNKAYDRYGGRGIRVCDEWQRSFKPFYEWAISNGYSDGLQIDRKDNNKGYFPDNCHFVTAKENSRNRRDNVHVFINNEKMVLAKAIELNIVSKNKFYRIKEYRNSFKEVCI